MSQTQRDPVADAIVYLRTLSREGVRPAEARTRLRLLQAPHEPPMQLVWEEQVADGSIHYDLLVREPGGTLSLSYSPDSVLPWPLRGVHRWSEKDLLRVNGTLLKVEQAIGFLDFVWREQPIVQRLVDACLIKQELEREPVEVSDEELQLALDGFRRARGLLGAAQLGAWLRERGLDADELERIAADEVMVAKLRERVTAAGVAAYHRAHRAELDSVRVLRLCCADAEAAAELGRALAEGRLELAAAMLAAEHAEVMTCRRHALAAEAAPEVVVHVLSFSAAPAVLDPQTHRAVEDVLFEAWLAERRARAQIDWNWGSAERE